MRPHRGFVISCDTCDSKTHEINTDNRVVAQRVAIDFLYWKIYKGDTTWKIACPKCVRKYHLTKGQKQRKVEHDKPNIGEVNDDDDQSK